MNSQSDKTRIERGIKITPLSTETGQSKLDPEWEDPIDDGSSCGCCGEVVHTPWGWSTKRPGTCTTCAALE